MRTTASLIRSVRSSKGFSQEYIANELGIKQSAYSNIESGKSDVTLSRLHEISALLEVSVFDLIIDKSNNSQKTVNDPGGKYITKNNNAYELSVTIKLNDPSKEKDILQMLGLKN